MANSTSIRRNAVKYPDPKKLLTWSNGPVDDDGEVVSKMIVGKIPVSVRARPVGTQSVLSRALILEVLEKIQRAADDHRAAAPGKHSRRFERLVRVL